MTDLQNEKSQSAVKRLALLAANSRGWPRQESQL